MNFYLLIFLSQNFIRTDGHMMLSFLTSMTSMSRRDMGYSGFFHFIRTLTMSLHCSDAVLDRTDKLCCQKISCLNRLKSNMRVYMLKSFSHQKDFHLTKFLKRSLYPERFFLFYTEYFRYHGGK